MDIETLLKNFRLEKVQLNTAFLRVEISFQMADKNAAWELYIELLTRIVTQPLPDKSGDEQVALDSIHSLFPTTREILRRHGREATEFSKIAIPMLNQIVRPFTAKWHKESLDGAFESEVKCLEFREQLAWLQEDLSNYNRLLSSIAEVEDLTNLENIGS